MEERTEHYTTGNKMKKLLLIAGCPGSGKNFLAEKLCADIEKQDFSTRVFTTDDFFVYNNAYNFDGSLLGTAHAWNLGRTIRAMMNEINFIVVPNTFSLSWECSGYYNMALKFNYEFDIVEPKTPWSKDVDELVVRNTHNVPREVIEKMLKRAETPEQILENLKSGKNLERS